ncbi:hypothetical protein [Tranquillimonas alkanivorans]|uniref:Uncharacterized protein n=1 Tax=Tranquillimonas alkanivorans TaxID=441119 RepID=A0A1I5VYD9_9RHOB|nr:hypothetical protein [Tranquillimonas alkanivorans]SFQ12423.1 hypothetical protein SAMN04488047_13725 [Tranquillimonas alkanivorans]
MTNYRNPAFEDDFGASRAQAPRHAAAEAGCPHLERARALTVEAAKWIIVFQFSIRPGGNTLDVNVTTYHEMLDPSAPDALRLAACRRMHEAAKFQAQMEAWEAKRATRTTHRRDPYGLEWCTTQRGAVLEHLAELLEAAIFGYEASGVTA